MTIKYNLLIAATLFATTSAMAGDFSLGAGAVFNESPYKGYNENTTAVPLISYEGDRFYVRQTTGGWILWKDAKNEFSLTASWMPPFMPMPPSGLLIWAASPTRNVRPDWNVFATR